MTNLDLQPSRCADRTADLVGAAGSRYARTQASLHVHDVGEQPEAVIACLAEGSELKQVLWKLGVVQNVDKACVDIGRAAFDRGRAIERRRPKIWRETERPTRNCRRGCDRRLGRHVGGKCSATHANYYCK